MRRRTACTTVVAIAPQLAMFNAPNNWAVDARGKFIKDLETDQFRAALGYVRDLYAAGVFYPEVVPSTARF